jgi:hypothetical protein
MIDYGGNQGRDYETEAEWAPLGVALCTLSAVMSIWIIAVCIEWVSR